MKASGSTNSDWKSWSTWIELEHSNPPEIGKQNIGLRKFRLEYQNDIFAFKVGDIYEYWGNGLILNMLDDQSIDLDTGTKGALFTYSNDFASFEYLHGKQQSWRSTIHAPEFDERIPNYKTDYTLNGLSASFDIANNSYDFYMLDTENRYFLPSENSISSNNSLLYGLSFNLFEFCLPGLTSVVQSLTFAYQVELGLTLALVLWP